MFGYRGERGAGRTALMTMTLLMMAASRLDAQESPSLDRQGWIIGGSLGMFGSGAETAPLELMTVGVNFTQVRPRWIGADISIGTMPRVLAEGVMVLGGRFDATIPVPVAPGVLLLPAAGFSVVGGAGDGGAGGVVGYNVGAAAVFGTGNVGFRTGLTWHRLEESTSGIWLLEVGIARLPAFRSH